MTTCRFTMQLTLKSVDCEMSLKFNELWKLLKPGKQKVHMLSSFQ